MLLAKPELLTDPNVPKGVKRYFESYAAKRTVLGQPVLVISERLHWNYADHQAFEGKQLGVGPGHTDAYDKDMPTKEDKRKGVKPGTFHPISVSTWLHEYKGDLVTMLYEIGERHDYSYEDD